MNNKPSGYGKSSAIFPKSYLSYYVNLEHFFSAAMPYIQLGKLGILRKLDVEISLKSMYTYLGS